MQTAFLLWQCHASKWTAGQITVTMTYGGQTLTLANGDMGTAAVRQHTALYYLNEAGLDAATGSTLSVTVSAGGATMVNTDIWAAVFDYINQTTPLTNTQTYSSGTAQETNFSFSTALTINAYNQAVEVVNSYNPNYNAIRTITYATNWTMILDSTALYKSGLSGASIRNGVANRSIPNSNISDPSSTTLSALALASMTALSLNYEIPPPPTVQTSNITFSDVTTSSFTINWTSGNGTNRIVLVKAGSAVDSDPVNGTTYTASDLFGSGSQIGTGNYVVYNGTGYNATVFNLDANTTYHVAVYEFSGPPGLEYYLTPPARGSQLTNPETALTDDYRSNGSGNWSNAGIWQTFDGSSWVTAGTAPNSLSGIITIRNGHTLDVAEAVTVDQVTVEAGGQVTVNPGITWTIADGTDAVDCNIDGTLNNEGSVTTLGVLAFNSGSAYHHVLDGGTIPTATWDVNSTCLVTGIANTAPTGLGQSFGNLTWNCVSQTVAATINSDAAVKGNFRLTATGSGKLSITDNNSRTLTISGEYIQTGGTFDLNSGPSSTAVANLNVAGNFYFTSGTMTESSSGRGSVIFNGGGQMQTYTSGGALSNTIDFTVESGAYLQMGTGATPSYISGSNGTFTLSSGATLGITDFYGITASTTGPQGGNIRVSGTRTFNTSATYIYNGTSNQHTRDGLPSTVSGVVFDNSGGSVIFDAAHTINSFSITSGSKANLGTFTQLTNSFSLGGVGQPSGTYGHSTSPATFKNDTYFDAATGIVNNQPPAGTWIGVTSTDWNTASNWIGGVPTSVTNVIIPSGPVYQPVVLSTPLAECNSITVESGASLTINSGQALTALGNINNSGTLNLISSGTGIASLIPDSYSGAGTTNIQLYLTGGGDVTNYPWHYVSSPVAGLSVVDVLSSGGDPAANDLAAYYEDLVTDNKDQAWIGYDGWNYQSDDGLPTGNTFSVLEVGRGYNYYSYFDATRTFGGNINTEDVTKNLSYTGTTNGLEIKGWNCLGNPFSSGLDWDAITKPTGVDNAIYFTVNNTVASYVNGVSNNGATGLIPPMQGFFVKANQSGLTLTLPASARVHNFHSRYKGEAEAIPLIRLKIENLHASDETVIRFDEKARIGFDSDLDAYKFGKTGNYTSLWTRTGSVSYSINSIPFPETKTEVPVGVNISEPGNYKLKANQLQGIDNYNIYLTDKLTGFTVNLKTTPSLSFNASKGMLSDRFVIIITNMSTVVEKPGISETNFKIYSSHNLINIQTLSDDWNGKAGSIGLVDMFGREITRIDNAEFWKNSLIQISTAGLRGIYFVKMQSGLMKHVGKVVIR